jgi:predicted AAA+ superfamily ATPase
MQKEFNDTGLCVSDRHYMVETSEKIEKIVHLIEKGKYFSINRPRQFGKTTTLFLLMKHLFASDAYLPLRISFEGLSTESYTNQKHFIESLFFYSGNSFR